MILDSRVLPQSSFTRLRAHLGLSVSHRHSQRNQVERSGPLPVHAVLRWSPVALKAESLPVTPYVIMLRETMVTEGAPLLSFSRCLARYVEWRLFISKPALNWPELARADQSFHSSSSPSKVPNWSGCPSLLPDCSSSSQTVPDDVSNAKYN